MPLLKSAVIFPLTSAGVESVPKSVESPVPCVCSQMRHDGVFVTSVFDH